MSKEEVTENLAPVYVVEEEDDEEETITLDFNNNQAYSKEEHLVVRTGDSLLHAKLDPNVEVPTIPVDITPQPPVDPFKNELQDLLLNTITSKAIGSLLKKHYDLDTKIDSLFYKNKMGELGSILDNEIDSIMEERRKELRGCYAGPNVKYERIPKWAQNYVKEYTKNLVHSIAILVEDGE